MLASLKPEEDGHTELGHLIEGCKLCAGSEEKSRNTIDIVTKRLVDLLIPFRNFDYYHPAQKGSASLKAVLPALTGISYEGMNIDNGEDASIAFLEVTFGDVSDEVRNKVREDLEKHCGLDTEGMIWIVDRLKEIAKKPLF